MTRILATVITAAMLIACGGDDSDSPDTRDEAIAATCERKNIAPEICALHDVTKALHCKQGPWSYTVIQSGWSARIECHAVGTFPGGAQRVVGRADESYRISLIDDASEWPMATCDMQLTVEDVDSGARTTVNAQLYAHDGTASVSTDQTQVAPAFTFTGCTD